MQVLAPRHPNGRIDWLLYEGNVIMAMMLGSILGIVLTAFR